MAPSVDEIEVLLADGFGSVAEVTVLQGGAWSSAYSFRACERELVLRI